MTDRVAIPLTDGRWLVLDAATFAAGIKAGATFAPQRPASDGVSVSAGNLLMTAEEIAVMTGIDASWFLSAARERTIPHVRLGKYVRFDLAAVAAHLRIDVGDVMSASARVMRARE